MSRLNEGKGWCQATASLLVRPVRAVIELGAGKDAILAALGAVHHLNRNGDRDDFIAVALPEMRMGRQCMLPGFALELIGSEASLSSLIETHGMAALKRRGMLAELEIAESFIKCGEPGTAYIRDRSCEKMTPGWIRRRKARAERRGRPWTEEPRAKANDLSNLALNYGRTVLHVRQITAKLASASLMVSTYGFSSPGALAVLPVQPAATNEEKHAS